MPFSGRREPAASWLLNSASPNTLPTPITSPVERISGPSTGSTPGNLLNGNTASLTLKYGGTTSSPIPCESSDWPAMQRAAIFASDRPVAFDTYGTVREARGFTSSTYTVSSPLCCWMANCTFIRPITFRALAMAAVWRFSSSTVACESEYGGSEQAESPECTPACSMCSITPPINTRWPSLSASTSHSIASFRKRSSSTGESCDTFTASRM
ncbi:hypothetical protein D3C81_1056460 [compost metagenome]